MDTAADWPLSVHLCLSGLQRIYSLTRSGGFELRIDMADFDNATAFARYSEFSVGRDSVNPEEDGYPLTVDGYSGTAGTTRVTTHYHTVHSTAQYCTVHNQVFLFRWLPPQALWDAVHHQRPRPGPVREQLCSILPGGVVVPELPHLQPEWAVPERRPRLICWWCGVVQLDGLAVLTSLHRDEDPTQTGVLNQDHECSTGFWLMRFCIDDWLIRWLESVWSSAFIKWIRR